MSARQTSIISYLEVMGNELVLTDSYKEILAALSGSPGLTDQEIARKCGYYDPNKVRPRRNELVKAGYLEENGKKTCEITKKTAIIWKKVKK